jgi:1,4-alpha-glucan branching enzyme
MSIRKQYTNNGTVCRVTFTVPREAVKTAQTVHVVGEFNNWNTTATPLKRQKSGEFTATIDVTPGKEYQFRYLINQTNWENDWNADKYVPTSFTNTENSVVVA